MKLAIAALLATSAAAFTTSPASRVSPQSGGWIEMTSLNNEGIGLRCRV